MNRSPITHVAIRFEGTIYALPCPNRHHHVLSLIREMMGISHIDTWGDDEGFLDSEGPFLNRKQALVNAKLNHQIKDETKIRLNMLCSEDVW